MDSDLENVTIGGLLECAVEQFGDREAYVFREDRRTFAQLSERVDIYARALMAHGVAPGDRVSLWMANHLDWVLVYLAVAQVGAVLVPVNTGFTTMEAGYVVGQSDSVLLIACAQVRGRFTGEEALQVLEDERVSAGSVVVVGEPCPSKAISSEVFLARGQEVSDADLAARKAAVRADDVVLTLYTSGTTGFPKGAMHSHKVIRNMADAAKRLELSSDDRLVLYLPLFHVFGAAAVLSFMYVGGCIVLQETYTAAESLELMEKERASVVYGIGTHFYDQMNHPDFESRDLASIRLCTTPGTADLVRLTTEKMGTAVNLYGMTETTSMTSVAALGDTPEQRAGTIGRPLPGFEVKIVDPVGRALAPGEVGELAVRGHPVMLGYYKMPEATAKVIDQEGWFHTGDAASLTDDGFLRYAGRIKEMFKVGGENVDPIEVEVVLMRHPAVAMASVIGIPDVRLDEVGLAHVQLRAGSAVSVEELQEFARTHLAAYKVPRRIVFVESYPMTGSGKIQKFLLKQQYLEDQAGAEPS